MTTKSLTIGSEVFNLNLDRPDFEGGEAWLFRQIKLPGKLIKVYKPPSHFNGSTPEIKRLRNLAEERGKFLLKKLQAFPEFPKNVIQPEGIVLNKDGDEVAAIIIQEVANSFELAELKSRDFCETKGYDTLRIANIFFKLHKLVSGVHKVGAWIKDFKPQNVLISGDEPYLVDAESIEFADFKSRSFTWEYADPLWVGSPGNYKEQPATNRTDWYAFALMYFESLTGVSPFSGVHFAPEGSECVQEDERAIEGITVFDEHVLPPQRGKPLRILNSAEIAYFKRIFSNKIRPIFNHSLIASRCIKKEDKKRKDKRKESLKKT